MHYFISYRYTVNGVYKATSRITVTYHLFLTNILSQFLYDMNGMYLSHFSSFKSVYNFYDVSRLQKKITGQKPHKAYNSEWYSENVNHRGILCHIINVL